MNKLIFPWLPLTQFDKCLIAAYMQNTEYLLEICCYAMARKVIQGNFLALANF